MCGYAFVSSRYKKTLKIDKNLLKHRGPDHTSEVDLNWSRTRHWRLSIQDLTPASDQPFFDNKNLLVYNGEIYDFRNLGEHLYSKSFKSDTQFLFHSLKKNNFASIKNESGFYSFLFVDIIKKKFFGARDYFGKKPLYYYFDDNLLIVSSEDTTIKKIAYHYGKKISVDKSSIAHYFKFKDLYFGKTFFNGVYELAPGSTLKFDFNRWNLVVGTSWKKYYSTAPFYREKKMMSIVLDKTKDTETEFKDNLINTIKKRFIADVPVQIALSGGIDSTLLTLSAKDNNNNFNRVITVSSNSKPSERKKSTYLSKKFLIEQFVINFDSINVLKSFKESICAQGGPLSHPHAFAINELCKEASKKGKVLITGEGADELMYGYEHYKKKKSTFAFAKHLNPGDFFYINKKEINNLDTIYKSKNFLKNNNYRDLDVKTHLLSLLRRNDRIAMYNSLEIRAAYLDFKLFKITSHLQATGKIKRGKDLLVKIIKSKFTDYKVDHEKIGFYVPFDEWFKKKIKTDKTLNYIVKKALNFLKVHLKWSLKNGVTIEGKLAWALLNIGLFLDLENKKTNE